METYLYEWDLFWGSANSFWGSEKVFGGSGDSFGVEWELIRGGKGNSFRRVGIDLGVKGTPFLETGNSFWVD